MVRPMPMIQSVPRAMSLQRKKRCALLLRGTNSAMYNTTILMGAAKALQNGGQSRLSGQGPPPLFIAVGPPVVAFSRPVLSVAHMLPALDSVAHPVPSLPPAVLPSRCRVHTVAQHSTFLAS